MNNKSARWYITKKLAIEVANLVKHYIGANRVGEAFAYIDRSRLSTRVGKTRLYDTTLEDLVLANWSASPMHPGNQTFGTNFLVLISQYGLHPSALLIDPLLPGLLVPLPATPSEGIMRK